MKLNKEQRIVLSNKIANEINTERKKSIKGIKPILTKHINPLIEEVNTKINKLNVELKKQGIRNNWGDQFLQFEFKNNITESNVYIGEKLKQVSSGTIYEELTLGEIDTPDLEQLIQKIKNKFK
jgi:hypothetical protein